MWDIIWGWLKGLFSGKGTSQIGSRNQSASGVTVGNNASVVAVGQGITVIQSSPTPAIESESPFLVLEKQFPKLLVEMQEDLGKHPFAREFVILKKTWVYNADPNKITLVYYFEDHTDLRNKLRILENYHLIQEITYNNTERFVLSEKFVSYLTSRAK